MAHAASPSLAQQLGTLFDGGSATGLSDRQLLERFVTRRDDSGEAAFAVLVARHGPMVLGVCRQLLGDRHHAEDAFQAVFLVLARKARSLREPELLGNWLYGVALRTARKARDRNARQRRTEADGAVRSATAPTDAPADQSMLEREQAEALHREIDRLPDVFRSAILLCYFERLALDEAAHRLRWPVGTLRSRLARAREKLRRGLLRRGVTLSGPALTAALAPRSASASVSPLLCSTTTQAATAFAFAARHAASGACSASATTLAQEVLRTMLLHTLRLTALSLLLVAAVATGAGLLLTHGLAVGEEPVKPLASPAASDAPRVVDRPHPVEKAEAPAPGRMTVTGHVLDLQGKPTANAQVDIIGAPRAPESGIDVEKNAYILLGKGATDGEGRFHIEVPRTASAHFQDVYALAGARVPGTGFGSLKLDPDAEHPAAEIRLRPEQVIRGRLVDVNGQPAAGVEVRLSGVYNASPNAAGDHFEIPGPGQGYTWSDLFVALRAIPSAVKTDAEGRFRFTGIGRGLSVSLAVRDPRFAQQRFDLEASGRDAAKEVSLALHPAKLIEGRVLAADTGRPIPNAVISVRASFDMFGAMVTTKFRADDQGEFKIIPYAGDYFRMRAFPPEGQPYLGREAEFAWTKGAVKKTIDLTLPRGALIQGKVAEAGTGRPVARASVQFFPMDRSGDVVHGFEAIVASQENGSFHVAVPPGKGHLMILGPTLDYLPEEVSGGTLYASGQRGGKRFYAHDVIAYDVKAGDKPTELAATLRPGKTLRGRLLGPEGEAIEDAITIARQPIDPLNLTWQGHRFVHARGGRFELHGLSPEAANPVYFFDAQHNWGATAELSGKQAGEDLTVRLQPCGQAKARFVGPDDKPLAKLSAWPYVQLLMTPGSTHSLFVDKGEHLAADATFLSNVAPKHYGNDFATDAEGRITMPALIPGASYRISDWSTRNDNMKGVQLRKDFTVKPGETLDLGDIRIEHPED
ncbi:RNA polymerase sigma factor, sigma-70 family [Singulisphaera sp. GP187]|uniref:sigma-70 family RNA polymerase sigma factor n=1 Tax=Singulisphaera sp. GP187 TaxID=1882752 RepID=UPI0009284A2A|nr:sigma-70 family RNA polymerase sigma factor [Singulisphaera sp. GP187]SIN70423.1 RNA polymerase sigma factor, sigma-70 family [Singulisphaera sp. GP187]